MKTHLGLLCLGIFLMAQLSAQNPKSSPYKWGEVPEEHLNLQSCPFDQSADAVVLSEYVNTNCDSIQIENLLDPDKSLNVNYLFSSKDFASQSGEYLYLDPMLLFGQEDNPFLEPDRKYPIVFYYLQKRELSLMFNIPEGYEVESLAQKALVTFPERDMTFRDNVHHIDNVVQVQYLYETHESVLQADTYPKLRQLYDHMLSKQGEQIVLRRR